MPLDSVQLTLAYVPAIQVTISAYHYGNVQEFVIITNTLSEQINLMLINVYASKASFGAVLIQNVLKIATKVLI